MNRRSTSIRSALWILTAVLLLSGCAGQREVLEPKSGSVPAGVDLSGEWRMLDDFEDMTRRIERAVRETDGIDDAEFLRRITNVRSGNRRPNRGNVGGLVHVFLENGERLKVTQTKDGLFIGFDRSVVEEYRFGEMRLISTGGARAQRVSGWEGDDYVVETLGEEGMKLTERYAMIAAGDRLTRHITLRGSDLEQVTIVQTFSRTDR